MKRYICSDVRVWSSKQCHKHLLPFISRSCEWHQASLGFRRKYGCSEHNVQKTLCSIAAFDFIQPLTVNSRYTLSAVWSHATTSYSTFLTVNSMTPNNLQQSAVLLLITLQYHCTVIKITAFSLKNLSDTWWKLASYEVLINLGNSPPRIWPLSLWADTNQVDF